MVARSAQPHQRVRRGPRWPQRMLRPVGISVPAALLLVALSPGAIAESPGDAAGEPAASTTFDYAIGGYFRLSATAPFNNSTGTPGKSRDEGILLTRNGSGWGLYDTFTATRLPEADLYELRLSAKAERFAFGVMLSAGMDTGGQTNVPNVLGPTSPSPLSFVRQAFVILDAPFGWDGADLTVGEFWDKLGFFRAYDRYAFGRVEGAGARLRFPVGRASAALSLRYAPHRPALDSEWRAKNDTAQSRIASLSVSLPLGEDGPTLSVHATQPTVPAQQYERWIAGLQSSTVLDVPERWGFVGGIGLEGPIAEWLDLDLAVSFRRLVTRTDDGLTVYNRGGSYLVAAFEPVLKFAGGRLSIVPLGWVELRLGLEPNAADGFGGLYVRGEYDAAGYRVEGAAADFAYWQKGKGTEAAASTVGLAFGVEATFWATPRLGPSLRVDVKDPNTSYVGNANPISTLRASDEFLAVSPGVEVKLGDPDKSVGRLLLRYTFVTEPSLVVPGNQKNQHFVRGMVELDL